MSYSNSSSAYDFSLFETRKPVTRTADPRRKAPAKKPAAAAAANSAKKSRAAVRAEQKQRVISAILSTALVISLAMLMVSKITYSELSDEISRQNKALSALVDDHDAMTVQFEANMSDSAIIEYVTSLGMQRRDAAQTEWISISNGDIFEIAKGRENQSALQMGYEKLLSYFG